MSPTSGLTVLFHDDALLAVDKPSGLITHRGWANDADNALVRARAIAGRHVHPVHRLDRATSGVLLFALDAALASVLGRQLERGGFDKRYLALVRGIPPDQVLVDHALAPEKGGPDKKPARTRVRRFASFERYTLVEAAPLTGRPHQVRRHLKHLSHPILGDTRYGDGKVNRDVRARFALHRLALHAAALSFTHPVHGDRVVLRAPLPRDLAEPLAAMGLLATANAMVEQALRDE